jgi:hypothetical protein
MMQFGYFASLCGVSAHGVVFTSSCGWLLILKSALCSHCFNFVDKQSPHLQVFWAPIGSHAWRWKERNPESRCLTDCDVTVDDCADVSSQCMSVGEPKPQARYLHHRIRQLLLISSRIVQVSGAFRLWILCKI